MAQIKLGDTTPTRDFNFVSDTCQGFSQLAQSAEAVGEVVNIGSNTEISVADTLNMIKDIMHSQVEFVSEDARLRPGQSEVFRLWCDNQKYSNSRVTKPKWDCAKV